jgi:hypothetical protein
MQVLTNGFKLPESGDLGDVWFPAIEDDIQQLNDHTHNGSDSEKIPSTSVESSHLTVVSGSFADQGNGYWRATVTLPAGTDYDKLQIIARDPASGEAVYLRHAKVSATSAYIYTNFVQNFEVYFLS